MHTYDPSTWEAKEDLEFKASFCYKQTHKKNAQKYLKQFYYLFGEY
jgi:hypothetical protein